MSRNGPDPTSPDDLVCTLKADPDPRIRAAAAEALGRLGTVAAIAPLEAALSDALPVRCKAIRALGEIAAPEVLPALMAMLRNQTAEVRYHAAVALGRVGNLRARQALEKALRDESELVRRGAAVALQAIAAVQGLTWPRRLAREIARQAQEPASATKPSASHEQTERLARRQGVPSPKRQLVASLAGPTWALVPSFLVGLTTRLPVHLPESARGRLAVAGVAAGLLIGIGLFVVAPAMFGGPSVMHWGGMLSVAFSPDGDTIAVGREDRTVELWSSSGSVLAVLEGHAGPVRAVAFSSDGERIASGSDDGTVRLWESDGDALQTTAVVGADGAPSSVTALEFSDDDRTLGCATADGFVHLLDAASGRVTSSYEPPGGTAGLSSSAAVVALSPGACSAAWGGADGRVAVVDLTTGETRTTRAIAAPGGGAGSSGSAPTTLAFSADATQLAAALPGGTLHVWNVESGETAATLQGPPDNVRGLAFGPDGRSLVAAGDVVTLLWDLSTAEGTPLPGYAPEMYGAAFRDDGRRLAAVGRDAVIRLWDMPSGAPATLGEM